MLKYIILAAWNRNFSSLDRKPKLQEIPKWRRMTLFERINEEIFNFTALSLFNCNKYFQAMTF